MIGTVMIYRIHFHESDIVDGALNLTDDNTTSDSYPVDTVGEAVDLILSEGLTFAATGNDWAAHPDGSYITDYSTGERAEVTAHLHHFSDADALAVMGAVG